MIQASTDKHPYAAGEPLLFRGAVEYVFGPEIDYAQLIKQYGKDGADAQGVHQARKHSTHRVTSQEVRVHSGDPDRR